MPETDTFPDVILYDQHDILRGSRSGVNAGWAAFLRAVGDRGILATMRQEAALVYDRAKQTGELVTRVSLSEGPVRVAPARTEELDRYPVTQSFTQKIAAELCQRLVSVQFNFYPQGSLLIPHNDGPGEEPETAAILSVAGKGRFGILPDPSLGFTDAHDFEVNPGDVVLLPAIPAQQEGKFTSRKHCVKNNESIERVSLVAVYSPPIYSFGK